MAQYQSVYSTGSSLSSVVTPRSLFFRLSQNKAGRDSATCLLTLRSPSLTPPCLFFRSPKPHIFRAHKSRVTSDPIDVVIVWQAGEQNGWTCSSCGCNQVFNGKLKMNFANFGLCRSLSMYSIRRTVHTILGVNVKPWLKIRVLVTKVMTPCY